MLRFFMPDRHFESYRELSPEFLSARGIRLLLSDIDNTLAPYEQSEPDEALRAWLAAMNDAGIAVAFVSNNHADRVELFNRTLGCRAYSDAHKPLKKTMRRAMREHGATPETTAMLGDQLLTDVLAGKGLGLFSFTVPPIRDKRDLFTRFKRLLERPVFRAYHKRMKKIEQEVKNHADT